MKKESIIWLAQPEAHDYDAATSFLNLLFSDKEVTKLVSQLKVISVSQYKAKDIFRASGESLLDESNHHVKKNIEKIKNFELLSPILLVVNIGAECIIADGYHRMCAVYCYDEDAYIPCKLVKRN